MGIFKVVIYSNRFLKRPRSCARVYCSSYGAATVAANSGVSTLGFKFLTLKVLVTTIDALGHFETG